MNDNGNLNNSNAGSYKASSNLNTAIENPNMDVDSVTSVNIQNNQYDNTSFDNSYNDFNNVNTNSDNSYSTVNYNNNNVALNNMVSYSSNNTYTNSYESTDNGDVNYEPVYEKKEEKNSKNKIIISRELKLIIFIAFLLFLFILLLPYLYNIFNKLILIITS